MTAEQGSIPKDIATQMAQRRLDIDSLHGNHLLSPQPGREDQFFVLHPNSDLERWFYEDEEAYRAFEAFPIWRLQRIKQLSFLAYIGPRPEIQMFQEFNHTRLEHTLTTARIVETIFRRNYAPEPIVTLGVDSSMAHDMATPALGDAAKQLDPESLDEENHWRDVLGDKGKAFLESRGITLQQMDDSIHNRGLVGRVLDIADRISYVMLDLHNLINTTAVIVGQPSDLLLDYRDEIVRVLAQDTNVGSIYRDVVVDWNTEDIYFTNPERLSRFLEIRALLNKHLYLHPVSQARDLRVAQALRPYYSSDESDESMLTPSKLRRMGDEEVLHFLSEKHPELEEGIYRNLGRHTNIFFAFVDWYPQYYERFTTEQELEQRKKELETDNSLVIIGQKTSKGFNPATDLRVMDDDGNIVPFREYDPHCSGRIERIAEATKGHFLYWEDKDRDDRANMMKFSI